MSADEYRLIDTTAVVDVGQGYSLGWCVDLDGHAWPLLVDSRQRDVQDLPHQASDFRELAPHEMAGRMPDEFQQFRCGAVAHTGRPCRSTVAAPGERCRHHQGAERPTSPPRPASASQPAAPRPATASPASRKRPPSRASASEQGVLFELEPPRDPQGRQ